MNGIILLVGLFLVFLILVMPAPVAESGPPRRELRPDEAPDDPEAAGEFARLAAEGFEGPRHFAFEEEADRPAALLVNGNLAVYHLRHAGPPAERRFVTFFTDGSLLVTGAPLTLKSLAGSDLVFGETDDRPTADLLARHAAILREAVKLGRLPKHASPDRFFTDLAETIDLADSMKVGQLRASLDRGAILAGGTDEADALADGVTLRRRPDGAELFVSNQEVSLDRVEPLPAALLGTAEAGFPDSVYRAGAPVKRIPFDRIAAFVIDRYGPAPAEWGLAVVSDEGRCVWLNAPDGEIIGRPGTSDDNLVWLAWLARAKNPMIQFYRIRRENGRAIVEEKS